MFFFHNNPKGVGDDDEIDQPWDHRVLEDDPPKDVSRNQALRKGLSPPAWPKVKGRPFLRGAFGGLGPLDSHDWKKQQTSVVAKMEVIVSIANELGEITMIEPIELLYVGLNYSLEWS